MELKMDMQKVRELALETYNKAVLDGMQDNPRNWHTWKRAFDASARELVKNIAVLDGVSVSSKKLRKMSKKYRKELDKQKSKYQNFKEFELIDRMMACEKVADILEEKNSR